MIFEVSPVRRRLCLRRPRLPSVSVAPAESKAAQMQVFDATDRVLYRGSVLDQEQLYERYQRQLIFEAYYDDQGNLLYAKKQFFVE